MNERLSVPSDDPFDIGRLDPSDIDAFEARPVEYDVLLANMKSDHLEIYKVLLLAAERNSKNIQEKEAFVHGFLYTYGLLSEPKRAAFLMRLFETSSSEIISDGGDGANPLPSA